MRADTSHMAVLHPSLADLDEHLVGLNQAQIDVARALSTLDDSWTVYVRPRIGQDTPDFIAAHDAFGVSVIEVRDWQPGQQRVSPHGSLEKQESSGAWVSSSDRPHFAAARTRANVYDQFFALPADSTSATDDVRAVVMVPHISDTEAKQLLAHATASDAEQAVTVWGAQSIADNLGEILRGTGTVRPRAESIQRLHQQVAVCARLSTNGTPIPRSPGVLEIETNIADRRQRRARGPAGSGKTFGVAARAAHLAAAGKSVLVLSFNVTLAKRLNSLIRDRSAECGADPTLVTCANFHSFCTRIVQDADLAGFPTSAPKGARWTTAIVMKASQAFAAGFERRFDAVLVDEGQDFQMEWWQLLRDHVVAPGGEMLLTVDPTQDLYGRRSWNDEAVMTAAGFDQPWIELSATYRLPTDLITLTNEFAASYIDGVQLSPVEPADRAEIVGASSGSIRRWRTVEHVGHVGIAIGQEVVRLLDEHPALSPDEVAFLCEYHHDGVAAVREIEAAGYRVHHIFSRDPDDARRRRKYRFMPTSTGVKGCTIHSFKGWDATVLVLGIGLESRSKRMAYMAMTRLLARPDRPSVLSVISADKHLDPFGARFDNGTEDSAALDAHPAADRTAVSEPEPAPFAPADPDHDAGRRGMDDHRGHRPRTPTSHPRAVRRCVECASAGTTCRLTDATDPSGTSPSACGRRPTIGSDCPHESSHRHHRPGHGRVTVRRAVQPA